MPLRGGTGPAPDVVSEAGSQIKEACGRLEAMSARDGIPCRCPAGYGP